MANNAVAVECVAGRSPSALKMFVARRVLDDFVFGHSSDYCRGSFAAVTVCIDRRRDIRLYFANTLDHALARAGHFRNSDTIPLIGYLGVIQTSFSASGPGEVPRASVRPSIRLSFAAIHSVNTRPRRNQDELGLRWPVSYCLSSSRRAGSTEHRPTGGGWYRAPASFIGA
jgi:hypothetical protein